MKLLDRAKIKLLLVLFLAAVTGILPGLSYSAPPSDRCVLIRVQIADKNALSLLLSMGLDVWEARRSGAVIRVTDNERRQIQESGFIAETITEDVYEYLETISREQISLFAEPAPAKYHSYDEVVSGLIALEDSGVAQTYIIGRTHEGRDIWAVKISDNPSEEEGEPGALFMGCHHACEWISVEVPYYLAQYLVNNYETDPEVKRLVDNCEVWIVPVVNPDGYVYTWTKDRLWRKNRRDNGNGTFGVDLNRNYGYMWGLNDGSSGNRSDWNYRGPGAFSEPETQAIRDLLLAGEFRTTMSYHSYGQLLYSPWGYTLDLCPDDAPMNSMIYHMKELIQETTGAVYIPWAEWEGKYPVSGDTGDWPYGVLGIYSFGAELRPETAEQGGFVLPANQIQPTCDENLPAALYLISLSVADGGIENINTGRTYGSIQFAVNDANEGDQIVLQPGVYQESVFLMDRHLTLRSTDPNDAVFGTSTIVKGYHRDPAITLSGKSDEACVLAGLTIHGQSIAISCGDASPTIVNCTVGSNGPNAIEFWEGYEPAITDCNLLAEVVQVNDPRIIAHWRLDEEDGPSAHDSAGTNDAFVIGGPIWQPDGGQVNGALEFDGIDDFISAPRPLSPGNGPFSVVAWVKGGAAGQAVLSQAGGSSWLCLDSIEGCLMTELKSSGRSSGGPLLSDANITDGNWHRIGFVWDGSYRHLYVDGVEVARDDAAQSALENSIGSLCFGASSTLTPGTFFSGLIDDIRIYNRAVHP